MILPTLNMNLLEQLGIASGKWFLAWSVLMLAFFGLNSLVDKWAPHRRFSKTFQTRKDLKREFTYFLLGYCASLLIAIVIHILHINGFTLGYIDKDRFGLVYYWLSFPLVLIAFDLYFYLTHRLLHTKWMFKHFHYVHHQSRDIGPLTSVSFHFFESVIIYSFALIYMLLVPVHPDVVMFFFWASRFIDVFGHSGYDYCPATAFKKPWNLIFSNTLHHYQHHQGVNGNFGLYFNYTDHLLKTQLPGFMDLLETHYAKRIREKSLTVLLFKKTGQSLKRFLPHPLTLAGGLCFFLSTQRFQFGWLFCLFSFVPWFLELNKMADLKPSLVQMAWIQTFIGLAMFGWMPLGASTVFFVPLTYTWAAYFLVVPFCIPYFFLFFISRFYLKKIFKNIFVFSFLAGFVYVTLDNALAFLDVTYSYFLFKHPALLSTARYGGGLFVTFWLIVCSELTVYGIENRRKFGLSFAMLPIPLFVLFSIVLDLTYTPEPGRSIQVGIIAPKWEMTQPKERWLASNLPTEEAATQLFEQSIAEGGNDFYVLPETIFRHPFFEPKTAVDYQLIKRFERAVISSRRPVFFGGKTEGYRNWLYVATPSIDSANKPDYRRYLKVHPMPFGERIPGSLMFPSLNLMSLQTPPVEDGTVPLRGYANGISWGGILCNEIFYADMTAEHRASGARIEIDLGNERAVAKTMAYDILMSAAVVRAIESAIPIVKSTISGVSGAIDYKGRIIARTETDTNSFLNTQVSLAPAEPTFFSLHPNLFLWTARSMSFLAALFCLFAQIHLRGARQDSELVHLKTQGSSSERAS